MNIWDAIILGIAQGVTEFIPVSSSGHLVIIPYLLNIPELSVAFIAFLHLGTLIGVLGFYWKDVWRLIIAFCSLLMDFFLRRGFLISYKQDFYNRLVCLIFFSTVIFGFMGLSGNEFFESYFENVVGVSIFLLVTGLLLWIIRKRDGRKDILEIGLWSALIIGFAQGVAIIPGISRSGTTIVAGLFCGLSRKSAVKYAFLLSIPAILGANLIKIKDIGNIENITLIIIGTAISAISGYLVIKWFVKIIQKVSLRYFAYYCWTVGLGVLLLYYVMRYNVH